MNRRKDGASWIFGLKMRNIEDFLRLRDLCGYAEPYFFRPTRELHHWNVVDAYDSPEFRPLKHCLDTRGQLEGVRMQITPVSRRGIVRAATAPISSKSSLIFE